MNKKLLLTLPVAALVVVVAPFVLDESWNSACACIPVNQSFAHYSGVSVGSLFKEGADERVTAGLSKRYPQGTPAEPIRDEIGLVYSRAKCVKDPAAQSWNCDIWLEKKDGQERGYAVRFQVSPDDKVTGVNAKRIFRAATSA